MTTSSTMGTDTTPAPLPLSQEALEAMPFPFLIATCDGLYVAANTLIEQLFRVPRAALIGSFNFMTDPAAQANGARAVFEAARLGQRGEAPRTYYDFSFPGTHNLARTGCWLESTFLPFRDATGQVTHIGMLIQDVSERVESEQKALRLTAMIENALDAMGTIDQQGRITYCNAAYLALTGYGPELIGTPITTIFAESGDAVLNAVNQVATQGQWQGQLIARRANGSSFPTEVSAFPLRDQTGQIIGMAAIIRDISERTRREDELRTFKAIVENTPYGVSIFDANGTVGYVNPAYRAMLGYDHDMIGMNGFEIIAPEDIPLTSSILASLPEQRFSYVEFRLRRADGGLVPVTATIFLQEAPDGSQQMIGFARDLTEQRRSEAERAMLQEQVIAAQQAALRELSTPLIPIAEGVVAMPLIGTIDSTRAQLVVETLLSGVAELRAHTTILDITGVLVVDTQVANALLRAAQAVRLLGATVILTGIRPEVAQTLVGLGIDLSGIITRGTLQAGITEALGRRSMLPQVR